jgi:hypothetical protein
MLESRRRTTVRRRLRKTEYELFKQRIRHVWNEAPVDEKPAISMLARRFGVSEKFVRDALKS